MVVMAAGMATRHDGIKQMDAVGPGGEAILEYAVYDAIRAGFGKVVCVIRPDIEAAFREAIGKRVQGRIAVDYICQEVPETRKKPWGTGHAILIAAEAVNEPFAAVNADNFYGAHALTRLGGHLRQVKDCDSDEYAMVGFVLRDTLSECGGVSRAMCRVDAEGFLSSISEVNGIEQYGEGATFIDEAGNTCRLSGDEIVSRNMWGFTPSIFGYLRRAFDDFVKERGRKPESEFLLPTVVGTLLAKDHVRVKVLRARERSFGMTYPEDKPVVVASIRDLIAQGMYPEKLWA